MAAPMKVACERYGVIFIDKLHTLPRKFVGICLPARGTNSSLTIINGRWFNRSPMSTLTRSTNKGSKTTTTTTTTHRRNRHTDGNLLTTKSTQSGIKFNTQLLGYAKHSNPLHCQQQRRCLSVSTVALTDMSTTTTGIQDSVIVTSQIPPAAGDLGGAGVSGEVDFTASIPLDGATISSSESVGEFVSCVTTEPTLASLGLCAHTPVGFIQSMLETLHVSCGLPWWAAITVFTIAARTLLLPLVVYGQKNAAHLSNFMPELQKRQQKFQRAKQSGSSHEMMLASSELQAFMRDNNVNPMKNFMMPLIQAPIFISFFLALRRMSEAPVESLMTGGCLWFTDLTLADPIFALPLLTSSTLLLCLELGAETGVENASTKNMKNFLRIMPFIILPITYKFPTVIFTYWSVSNFYTLFQVGLLRIPVIREWFGIPERKVHPPGDMPPNNGFFKGIKEGWEDAQKSYEITHRHQRHNRALKDSALGPVPKTFSYDPTKSHTPSSTNQVDDSSIGFKTSHSSLPPPMNPFSKKPIN